MNKILILYPQEFKCFSKFERKISHIVQDMKEFSFLFPSDYNQFIRDFCEKNFPEIHFTENPQWTAGDITHAIIFDDGEVFSAEQKYIADSGKPHRIIQISITRVINIKREVKYQNLKSTPEYEYIGRGSYWGNPYSMYDDGDDRDEVIRKYKYDFNFNMFPNKERSEVYKLAGKRLGCFCNPQPCHGDVLADFLNSWDDDK